MKGYDEYEKTLRKALCTCPAVNVIILFIYFICSCVDFKMIYYHELDHVLEWMWEFLLFVVLAGAGLTLLEWRFRGFFIFREAIRTVIGGAFVVGTIFYFWRTVSNMTFIKISFNAVVLIIFTFMLIAPLTIYFRAMQKHEKQTITEDVETGENDDEKE